MVSPAPLLLGGSSRQRCKDSVFSPILGCDEISQTQKANRVVIKRPLAGVTAKTRPLVFRVGGRAEPSVTYGRHRLLVLLLHCRVSHGETN